MLKLEYTSFQYMVVYIAVLQVGVVMFCMLKTTLLTLL